MSYSPPPKFYKIMMPNHGLQNGELRMPKIFVDKYWKGVSNPVVLRFPNGAQQKVFWVEHNGYIWLKKNWEKIAKSLKYGYFVVFNYKGGSYFKVEIFGRNTVEMDYSNLKFEEGVGEVTKDAEEDNVTKRNPAGTSQGIKNSKRNRNMNHDTTHQNNSEGGMNKKAKKCLKTETVKEEDVEIVEVSDNSVETLDEINDVRTSIKRKFYKIKRNVDLGSNRGGNYQPHMNPKFSIPLSLTYSQGHYLRIPSWFSRKYLKEYEGIAIIRVGEDMAIKVNLHFEDVNGHVMTTGWKLFAQTYNLKVDDVCNFEMTQLQPLSFIVTINPARKEPYESEIPAQTKRTEIKKRNVKMNFDTTERKFSGSVGRNVMKQNSFELIVNSKYYPYIPNEFLDNHKELNGYFVELRKDGKSWFVKVKYYDRGSRFYAGWGRFKEDCKLENGDIYLFELIDERKFVFKVSFLRKNL